MIVWLDRWLCRHGRHRFADPGPHYQGIEARCVSPGCGVTIWRLKPQRGPGNCDAVSLGSMVCLLPYGHIGQHYHPAYGAWTGISVTIPKEEWL